MLTISEVRRQAVMWPPWRHAGRVCRQRFILHRHGAVGGIHIEKTSGRCYNNSAGWSLWRDRRNGSGWTSRPSGTKPGGA